ncbi:MAG: XRE family transcriptional regulator [Desulfuromonadales bacterium]|nr:MAG: XRE family transcriptional regulator [Desulfuromonadales bacterium]
MDNRADKNDRAITPIVAIDGSAIRRIREAKRLTQLYVASVVGVTTDTISRWENNRYPTIKRDNAEKLASSLEVPLEEILRQDPSPSEPVLEADAPLPVPPRQRFAPLVLAGGLVTLMVALVVWIVLFRLGGDSPVATRWVPAFCAPGQIVPVQVKVARGDDADGGFIVKERIPAGWRFLGANPPVTGDVGEREVKWLVPGGTGPVTISYTLVIPQTVPLKSAFAFDGEIVRADGSVTRKQATGGAARLTVDGIHWADVNSDGRIDDNEIMPAYYLTEEMKGLGPDWKTIESLWSSTGYTWNDRLKIFEVVR